MPHRGRPSLSGPGRAHEAFIDLHAVLVAVGQAIGSTGKMSVTQAKEALRQAGPDGVKAASRLGRLTKARNAGAHPDLALLGDVRVLLDGAATEPKGKVGTISGAAVEQLGIGSDTATVDSSAETGKQNSDDLVAFDLEGCFDTCVFEAGVEDSESDKVDGGEGSVVGSMGYEAKSLGNCEVRKVVNFEAEGCEAGLKDAGGTEHGGSEVGSMGSDATSSDTSEVRKFVNFDLEGGEASLRDADGTEQVTPGGVVGDPSAEPTLPTPLAERRSVGEATGGGNPPLLDEPEEQHVSAERKLEGFARRPQAALGDDAGDAQGGRGRWADQDFGPEDELDVGPARAPGAGSPAQPFAMVVGKGKRKGKHKGKAAKGQQFEGVVELVEYASAVAALSRAGRLGAAAAEASYFRFFELAGALAEADPSFDARAVVRGDDLEVLDVVWDSF